MEMEGGRHRNKIKEVGKFLRRLIWDNSTEVTKSRRMLSLYPRVPVSLCSLGCSHCIPVSLWPCIPVSLCLCCLPQSHLLKRTVPKWVCSSESSDLLLGVSRSHTVNWSHLAFWLWNENIVWHGGEAGQCERDPCRMLVALAGAKCWSPWTGQEERFYRSTGRLQQLRVSKGNRRRETWWQWETHCTLQELN